VIVLCRGKRFLLDAEAAGHSQMQAKPGRDFSAPAETEEHLLRKSLGAKKCRSGQSAGDAARIDFAQWTGIGVERESNNSSTHAGIPQFSIVFDLGQFGHRP
jgi:hypothetical protein